MYTEQEIVKLWKFLLPSIKESKDLIEIQIKGQNFSILKQNRKAEKNKIRQIGYGR